VPPAVEADILTAAGTAGPTPTLGREFVVSLYERFAKDLHRLDRLAVYRSAVGGMYHEEERRILYLMVRHHRPRVVVEFSPHKGWSTIHLAQALEDNGEGRIHSFELDPQNIETATRVLTDLGLGHRVGFVTGDVRSQLPLYLPDIGEIDFLFVDSHHGWSFGRWWMAVVLPHVRVGGLVHVHDIEYSRAWGWRALEWTHRGGNLYGRPRRRYVDGEHVPWFDRLSARPRLWKARLRLLQFLDHRIDREADVSFAEQLALRDLLSANATRLDWLSLRALVEDPDYRRSAAPLGGGSVSGTSQTEAGFGFERNPTVYFRIRERLVTPPAPADGFPLR